MNDCQTFRERLPLFLSNELDGRAETDCQAHLATCSECPREVEGHRRVDTLLRGAFARQQVDARAVRERIRREIQVGEPPRVGRPPAPGRDDATGGWRERLLAWVPVRRRPGPTFGALAAVAAAIVVIAASAAAYFAFFPPGGRAEDAVVYTAVAADHYGYVVQRARIKGWLRAEDEVRDYTETKFQDPTLVTTLTPPNCKFSRVKTSQLAGGEYAHFIYAGEDGREAVSVFVRRRDSPRGTLPGRPAARTVNGHPLYAAARGETRLAGFDTPRLTVLVASELPPEENLRLARTAAERLKI